MKKILHWCLCAAIVTLMGCAGDKGLERPLNAGEEFLDSQTVIVSVGETTPPMVPIYFNTDSSGIREDQVSRLEYNAGILKSTDGAIRLEGNTDPTGTNEYNMSLGERRALAVKKYLAILGIEEDRMSTTSFGEERNLGMAPEDYVLERRSDLVVE